MNQDEHCPCCRTSIAGESVTLWDDRSYCRRCVEKVSPELYEFAVSGAPLEDTIRYEDVRALRFVWETWKRLLVFVTLFFGVPFLLLALAGMEDGWFGVVFVYAFFGGIGLIFLLLQSAIGIHALKSRLPRTVSVQGGQLNVSAPDDEASVPLSDCEWYFGSAMADGYCWFTKLRRGVVVRSTNFRPLGCGHSPEALTYWRAFLTLARVPEKPPRGYLFQIAVGVVGLGAGVAIGASLGRLVGIWMNDEHWIYALGMVGAAEGIIFPLAYVSYKAGRVDRVHAAQLPLRFALGAFAVCLMFAQLGWSGALVCGSANALIGALVGWLCRRKVMRSDGEVGLSHS